MTENSSKASGEEEDEIHSPYTYTQKQCREENYKKTKQKFI
jgi:hypothetical protein